MTWFPYQAPQQPTPQPVQGGQRNPMQGGHGGHFNQPAQHNISASDPYTPAPGAGHYNFNHQQGHNYNQQQQAQGNLAGLVQPGAQNLQHALGQPGPQQGQAPPAPGGYPHPESQFPQWHAPGSPGGGYPHPQDAMPPWGPSQHPGMPPGSAVPPGFMPQVPPANNLQGMLQPGAQNLMGQLQPGAQNVQQALGQPGQQPQAPPPQGGGYGQGPFYGR